MPVGVGVLASGGGSNLAAILEAKLPVRVVVADRPCAALDIAREARVPAELVQRESFDGTFDRKAYTLRVIEALSPYSVGLVVMAGFGTILDPAIYDEYPARVLNTHPSLLPKYKGWHAVRDALHDRERVTGCTIHVATPEVDEGPVLAQEVVPIVKGDTEEALHQRIKEVEHRLYPATIETYMAYLQWVEQVDDVRSLP